MALATPTQCIVCKPFGTFQNGSHFFSHQVSSACTYGGGKIRYPFGKPDYPTSKLSFHQWRKLPKMAEIDRQHAPQAPRQHWIATFCGSCQKNCEAMTKVPAGRPDTSP